jgi:hypothetical protein
MRISLILLWLITMSFWSVSGQNDETLLLGQWKLMGWYDEVPRDINRDGKSSMDLLSQWQGCKKQSILVLAEDHSGKIIYTGGPNNLKCPPNFKNGDFFSTGSWALTDGGSLRILNDDYEDIYEIVELDAHSLILKGSGLMTCCDPQISYFTGGFLKFKRK